MTANILSNNIFDYENMTASYSNNTTIEAKREFVVLTGVLTRDDYLFYMHIFSWIKAVGQPVAVLCMSLSAAVFTRKGMRNPTTVFLVALNLAEAYNLTLLTVYQVCILGLDCLKSKPYGYFRLWTSTYLGMACRRCVYVFNCLVSVQRFVVIAFPVRAKKFDLLQRSLPVCMGVFLFSLVLNSFLPVKYTVTLRQEKYVLGMSSVARENPAIFDAFSTSSMYLMVYIPLIVGALANVGLVVSLKRHGNSMEQLTTSVNKGRKRRKDIQMNLVVVMSTCLFFIFSLPSNINFIVASKISGYGIMEKEDYLYRTLSAAFVVSQTISDLIIFASYICACEAFRHQSLRLLLSLPGLRWACAPRVKMFDKGAQVNSVSVIPSADAEQI